ncbi:hypothetical protein [Obesumbacterium proteus]|uniref:hypothetical protein n=1 Tax=Obesumbacterium proteus TaxID=82983 RepID=UPI0012DE581A|nr:hypothetical protein [Obesumbacterium proteus]
MATDKKDNPSSLVRLVIGYLIVIFLLVLIGVLLYLFVGPYFKFPELSLPTLLLWGVGCWFILSWFCPLFIFIWDRLARSRVLSDIKTKKNVETKKRRCLGTTYHPPPRPPRPPMAQ